MSRLRILIAEDGTLFRRLLVQQLSQEADFEVVGEAADGREAVECAPRLRPDVVLMDLNMPHLNGIQAMERIRAQCPGVNVILLTAHEDLKSLGRLSGAAECLDKGCTPQELVAAVRQARALPRPGTGEATAGGDYGAAIERAATRGGLTEREKAVVCQIVIAEQSNKEIAQTLSKERNEKVTEMAVKRTLDRAMTKLAVEPRTRAALMKYVMES
jgi:DNA-binding NarL/FixJ family response regulator